MTTPGNIALTDEPVVTSGHRERAASALSEIGKQVEVWVETGNVDPHAGPLNDQLIDIAQSFADFEHELLLCPSIVVHGMEDSSDMCSNCGTSAEDYHTIRDCFARYKRAQYDAAGQVTAYLERRVSLLDAELKALYAGGAAHVCVAIGGDDCPHCPICGKDLAKKDPPPLHVYWDSDSIWVVARDADDAELVYAEHIDDVDSFDRLEFERWPDEKEISIRVWVKGPDTGKIAPVDEEDGTDDIAPLSQPARFWVDQCGRGFLCTTDY